ncbi:MAG TPA: hypothetical protein VFK02_06940 [Kofleriaceae bacterium]|nr:hypothetical protein [Kofleriaceae bacterium]
MFWHRLHRLEGWPPGIYEGPPLLWTRLVVVSELPVTPDTLLLRLLGAGQVLRQRWPLTWSAPAVPLVVQPA